MKVFQALIKWLAHLVLALSAALLVIIFLSSRLELGDFWLRILVLLAAALLGSLASRLLFPRLPAILLLFVNLVNCTLAILIIDIFYEGSYQLSFFIKPFTFQVPSLSDGGQLALLLLASLPGALLFRRSRKKRQKTPAKPTPIAQPARPSLRQRAQPLLMRANPAHWTVTKQIAKQITIKKRQWLRPKSKAAKPAALRMRAPQAKPSKSKSVKVQAAPRKTGKATVRMPRRRFSRQSKDVRLRGEEEHVCPYCLEQVTKHDSRGVVICPECGTWHHQDCWDLTGTCGVAHRNEL